MRVSADYLAQCTAATFLPVDRDEFRNPALYLASTVIGKILESSQ